MFKTKRLLNKSIQSQIKSAKRDLGFHGDNHKQRKSLTLSLTMNFLNLSQPLNQSV